MQDSYGNYQANMGSLPADSAPSLSRILQGAGSPNGVVTGALNQLYFDTTGAAFYQNTDGGTTWTAVASGGGTAPLYGSGSPEGVKTAPPGTSYLDPSVKTVYYKETGTGNTGWNQYI